MGNFPSKYLAQNKTFVDVIDVLFTPLVDRKSVKLAPVLTIIAQVLLGVTFGFIGILLASPISATVLIIAGKLYVEDILCDRMMPALDEAEPEKSDSDRTADKHDA